MAWETGTATDYKNLLLKLKDFLTTNATLVAAGQAWEVLSYDNTSADHTLMLKGKGLGGLDKIYVGISTEYSTANDYFNWVLYGMTGYTAGQPLWSQPGALRPNGSTTYNPRILLHNGNIKYWFVATGRYFIVIAKVSTIYESLFMGLIDPYGAPNVMPYPLYIGGSFTQFDPSASFIPRWSLVSNTAHGAFPFAIMQKTTNGPVCSQAHFWFDTWLPTGAGTYLNGNVDTSGSDTPHYTANYVQQLPFVSIAARKYGNTYASLGDFAAPLGGVYPLHPMVLVRMQRTGKAVFGEVPCIFAIPGVGLVAEDTVTVNGATYLVVPNTWRANSVDYFAVKLEA